MAVHESKRYRLWIVIVLLLSTLVALSTMLHVQRDRIEKIESRIDSVQVEADGVRVARDSLLSVVRSMDRSMPDSTRQEILWATRTILSETKWPSEMVYIASVIRNRRDMHWRGAETVRDVVLDPMQFSAFNPGRKKRWRYINLEREHTHDYLWDAAWRAAEYAMTMPRSALPVGPCVTHFFYPNVGRSSPRWPLRMEQVDLGSVHLPRVNFYRTNKSQCHG